MKMDKSVQITLIIVLGIVVLGLVSMNLGTTSTENTIQVQGLSTVKALPDLVGIYFNVDTSGTTSSEAASKNSEIVSNLTSSLEALGFTREQIQTQSYNVYPDYNYQNGQNILKGYKATHSIKVEMPANDSPMIGKVVDAGINSGAGIGYINFELSQGNQNAYKAEAIKLAAQDATTKAQAIADGFDKKLGKLVSTSVDNFGYVPWLAADFSTASGSAEIKQEATSIQPSEQEISASVTATFKLE